MKKAKAIIGIIFAALLPIASIILTILTFINMYPLWAKLMMILMSVYLLARFIIFVFYEFEELWEEI